MSGEPDGAAGAFGRVAGWWRWGVVLAYLALIYALSSRSLGPYPAGLLNDKVEHFAAYAVMSALVVWAVAGGDWRRTTFGTVLLATLFCTAYGWLDEIHQLFVPSRQYDLRDLAADGAGAFTAAVALWAWGIIARVRGQSDDL